MAVSCDPSDLAEAAKCFTCLNAQQRDAIKVYLLQQMIGDTSTPDQLLAEAKCFGCLNEQQLRMVIASLLCRILNSI